MKITEKNKINLNRSLILLTETDSLRTLARRSRKLLADTQNREFPECR